MEQTLRIPTSGPVMALMGQFSTGGKQGWRQAGLGLNPDSALPLPHPPPCHGGARLSPAGCQVWVQGVENNPVDTMEGVS